VEPEVFETLAVHPFRLSQCCLVTDSAVILGPGDRACDFPQKSVSLLGTGDVVESVSGHVRIGTTSADFGTPSVSRPSASAIDGPLMRQAGVTLERWFQGVYGEILRVLRQSGPGHAARWKWP
jgi:hypothetical protein